jgi:thioredoxin-like negative regulator of GroEL
MTQYTTSIPNKAVHDTVVAESAHTPTVIYVCNSSLPICKSFTPQYESLAHKLQDQSRTNCSKRNVKLCVLEFGTETSAMFKFSPNQLPVVVLMCSDREGKNWARTMMSPRIGELEEAVEDMRERAGTSLRN